MAHRVELQLSEQLYRRLQAAADRAYRSVDGQILWVLDTRYGRAELPDEEAVEALRDALAALHLAAGKPTTRSLGTRTGLSHTTVHGILRVTRAPRWANLKKVVRALDGDVEEFRALWAAAQPK